MKIQDVLLAYSEFLDGEHLVEHPTGDYSDASHQDLVDMFVAKQASRETPISAFIDSVNASATQGEPMLGLATTMDLITELQARASISLIAGESWPKYRTVDHD